MPQRYAVRINFYSHCMHNKRLSKHACILPIPEFSAIFVDFDHKFGQRGSKSRSLTGLMAGSTFRPSHLPLWRWPHNEATLHIFAKAVTVSSHNLVYRDATKICSEKKLQICLIFPVLNTHWSSALWSHFSKTLLLNYWVVCYHWNWGIIYS